MTQTIFRIHPTINFARVGDSDEYYIAPETAAGEIAAEETGLLGGLPIRAGTEDTPITAEHLRDSHGRVRRQAARFRLFAYDEPQRRYPDGGGREVTIGATIATPQGPKTIRDIIWMVHLANKKANNYKIAEENGQELGILAYEDGRTPPVRNPDYDHGDLAAPDRRLKLVIDAGPRALPTSTRGRTTLAFNSTTTPTTFRNAQEPVVPLSDYPVSFPFMHFKLLEPQGRIDTLGEMTIEAHSGRLLVIGGYGRAVGILDASGKPPPLEDAIDNNRWFDDTSDGPVSAFVVFDDGSWIEAVGAWFVCTDPGYAPQVRNVVSTWDDIYSTWVEKLALIPELFSKGQYNHNFPAAFDRDVLPIFHAALLQRWVTNLPEKGIRGHEHVAAIGPSDDPKKKIPNFDSLIRKPEGEDAVEAKMPLALGDALKSFLSLNPTQYFLLRQWYNGKAVKEGPAEGPGERLDRVVLTNCLGGRYSPGIDLTFIVRDTHLYDTDWQGVTGPFRINRAVLDYAKATKDHPFLSVGYVPLRDAPVEPGDLCKFMALPWHCDYNSCAVHEPDPNPKGNNTLYWSWPAQRPVAVYPASLCRRVSDGWEPGPQLFSVRGDEGHGTQTPYPQRQGRYQCYFDFVENWPKVGFVIQGVQVPAPGGGTYGSDMLVEAASQFPADAQDAVPPWPTSTLPGFREPTDCGP